MFVIVFVDDIFIYSRSEEEHTNHFGLCFNSSRTNNSLKSSVNVILPKFCGFSLAYCYR